MTWETKEIVLVSPQGSYRDCEASSPVACDYCKAPTLNVRIVDPENNEVECVCTGCRMAGEVLS